ncbi:MAG TPA: tRNA (adenosine(37)-N6)-dimethylallyltransferase MiaA [Candidatus Paceibacterota bacterium]|nr:tRNA (adenosine(37)-N6)-dimethylallyltransferase MiaA [Candidatus Paceibacterota bacterium]
MKRQAAKRKPLPKIAVVLGPTATGKSDLAVELALAFGGEVVSADSRQVYRGLDIGAGKVTKTEMKGVPHHLLDVADPRDRRSARYTVDDFRRDGQAAIADILSRGRLPIVCGGTGFYIDALVYDERFPDVPPDQALRDRLAKRTTESLMREIERLDPRRARDLDHRNKVRIIRAIEIARTLGSVPPATRNKRYDALWIGLTAQPDDLRKRIHDRLLRRMDAGMVREVASLHRKGVSWKRLHAFGLEYRHIALYLQKKPRKKTDKTNMLEALEHDIVDFSKRQMRWFKRNPAIRWFEAGKRSAAIPLVRRFLKGR